MRILHQIRKELAAMIAAAAPDVELIAVPADGELAAEIRAEVLVVYPWASANIAALLERGVKWVHAIGTGVDAFPLRLITTQTLTCSRGASAIPISEWTLAVMLAFEKHLPEVWIHAAPERKRNLGVALGGLHGKALGLVGIGGIGTAVAERALPFGMHVRGFRRSGAPAEIAGVEVVRSLHELVAASDHIVIAAPATAATRHMFDRDAFAAVKPGVHLVNIARGSLIDQEALRAALDDGRVAMASLDAVEPEPLPAEHWMYTHPRVRLSPHISWSMPGAAELLIEPFLENLRRYRRGEALLGVVDVAAGY